VRHEHVRVHPDIVAGLHLGFAGGTGEEFFSQRHRTPKIPDAQGKFNCAKQLERLVKPRLLLSSLPKTPSFAIFFL